MSPETIKVNGQAVQTEKKELTPVQQWDQLAFQVIYNEICPKGFRKVKNGKYRGSEYVEMPRKAVVRVQRVSAQLIRGFRDLTKKQITDRIDTAVRLQNDAVRNRDACKFWEISKRNQHQKEYEHFRDHIGLLEIVKNQLDQVGIK